MHHRTTHKSSYSVTYRSKNRSTLLSPWIRQSLFRFDTKSTRDQKKKINKNIFKKRKDKLDLIKVKVLFFKRHSSESEKTIHI